MDRQSFHSYHPFVLSEDEVLLKRSRYGKRVGLFVSGVLAGLACVALTLSLFKTPADAAEAPFSLPVPLQVARNILTGSETAPVIPTDLVLKVESGDTLSDLLTNSGVEYQEAHDLMQQLRKHFNPRSLKAGQELQLHIHEAYLDGGQDFAINQLTIPVSSLETLIVSQKEKGRFNFQKEVIPIEVAEKFVSVPIESSIYQSGDAQGIPQGVLAQFIKAFSYDVDFQREIRAGDSFSVLYQEKTTPDGRVVGYGDLLRATIVNNGKEKKIFYHKYANGEGFFHANGESVKKSLLRTPINGARLSSGFGKRKHPVLGYTKMHKGIDFAAPTGTPIYAAGDGVVEYASVKGGYGKYVRIKHTGRYSTAYAHMSRIATVKGKKVKQGQIIGYVGTTGRSTGPHLHYEILTNNVQVNPQHVKFKTGVVLAGKELASFKAKVRETEMLARRLEKGESQLAKAE